MLADKSLLLAIDVVLIALVVWMIAEGMIHVKKQVSRNV